MCSLLTLQEIKYGWILSLGVHTMILMRLQRILKTVGGFQVMRRGQMFLSSLPAGITSCTPT